MTVSSTPTTQVIEIIAIFALYINRRTMRIRKICHPFEIDNGVHVPMVVARDRFSFCLYLLGVLSEASRLAEPTRR